ncbi:MULTISPECIES: serine hydrolase domain-containing protein [unclassified Marinobacter]|uniref:serine hydrolase domain-containing protein n=1 Tax=unclassified Marinobacter TaxID=83889 RepID=UPI0018F1F1D4|nr:MULTISPECIES: serine hydrolase domain-containing protein [unclassified Marinobacter]
MKRARSLAGLFLIIIFPFLLVTHYWITDRNAVLRAIYPLQAYVSEVTIDCSPGAPDWLGSIVEHGIWGLRSLSTQVVFIDIDGNVDNCESGWEDGSLFKKVDKDSKFYYGSLTKPITAAALMILNKESKISYDDNVYGYLNVEEKASSDYKLPYITVDDLMKHRSWIVGNIFNLNKASWCPYAVVNPDNYRFNGHGSKDTKYSNLGYCLLGEVLANQMSSDYRKSIDRILNLEGRGIEFANAWNHKGTVQADFRYNDFYGNLNPPSFDYYAISSSAGLVGSAYDYALLVRDLLEMDLDGFFSEKAVECDDSRLRSCYGRAFYVYRCIDGQVYNIKEGYMPGYSGVVVINSRKEIFVWLGNSDTNNAANGVAMEKFIAALSGNGF